MAQLTSREHEIVDLWRQYRFFYQILGGLLLVGLGVWIGSLLFSGDEGYSTNLYTEVLSIGVTVFVLDLLARHREEQRQEHELKLKLIREAASQVNDIANHAVEELRQRGWLEGEDGALKGANLFGANLQRVNLWGVNLAGAMLDHARLQAAVLHKALLDGASLRWANLQGAVLQRAQLAGACLRSANLQGAIFWMAFLARADLKRANLQECVLWQANLQEADLSQADLRRAQLEGADLTGGNLDDAALEDAEFDRHTILPDGRLWTADTDMRCFTDAEHPHYWRPAPDSAGKLPWWCGVEHGV